MGPNDETTSRPFEWFGNRLSNWEELISSTGKFKGTAKSVPVAKKSMMKQETLRALLTTMETEPM